MYVVVLAGGSGTRLWPLSRRQRPKQLLRLTGDRSLLQQTVDRVRPIVPIEHVLVVTEQAQAPLVAEELPELPPENILAEPAPRGTAGALGLAATWIRHRAPDEVMASLHSDHLIGSEDQFRDTLVAAVEAASDGRYLLTLGIRPTEPATSYGYLHVGDRIATVGDFAIHRVQEFVEKPNRPRAEEYLASGDYLWNSGIFVWRVSTILDQFARHLPRVHDDLRRIADHLGKPSWEKALAEIYPTVENQTIDVGIMERAGNVATVPASFSWSDVGSWAELLEVLPSDREGNVVRGTHFGVDTHHSLVFGAGKPIATIGLDDIVVVDTPDVLLVCRRDRAQDVKKIVERLAGTEEWRGLL